AHHTMVVLYRVAGFLSANLLSYRFADIPAPLVCCTYVGAGVVYACADSFVSVYGTRLGTAKQWCMGGSSVSLPIWCMVSLVWPFWGILSALYDFAAAGIWRDASTDETGRKASPYCPVAVLAGYKRSFRFERPERIDGIFCPYDAGCSGGIGVAMAYFSGTLPRQRKVSDRCGCFGVAGCRWSLCVQQ